MNYNIGKAPGNKVYRWWLNMGLDITDFIETYVDCGIFSVDDIITGNIIFLDKHYKYTLKFEEDIEDD